VGPRDAALEDPDHAVKGGLQGLNGEYERSPFYEAVILLIACHSQRSKRLESVVGSIDWLERTVLNWAEFEEVALLLLRRDLIAVDGLRFRRTASGDSFIGTKGIPFEDLAQLAWRLVEMPETSPAATLSVTEAEYQRAVKRYSAGFGAMPLYLFFGFLIALYLIGLLGMVVAKWIYR
jgi:hypothetical protein